MGEVKWLVCQNGKWVPLEEKQADAKLASSVATPEPVADRLLIGRPSASSTVTFITGAPPKGSGTCERDGCYEIKAGPPETGHRLCREHMEEEPTSATESAFMKSIREVGKAVVDREMERVEAARLYRGDVWAQNELFGLLLAPLKQHVGDGTPKEVIQRAANMIEQDELTIERNLEHIGELNAQVTHLLDAGHAHRANALADKLTTTEAQLRDKRAECEELRERLEKAEKRR